MVASLAFNSFRIFEYKVNDMSNLQFTTEFPFNAYEIEYCMLLGFDVPMYWFRCKIFPILNLINNLFNDVLFLFANLAVDLFLIRFIRLNLKRQKNLFHNDQEKLKHAINVEEKVNHMVVANTTLYLVSHLPQLLVTILLTIFKRSMAKLCITSFSCNDFNEVSQIFIYLSYLLQIVVFFKFDSNFHDSFIDLKQRYLIKKKK